MCGIAWNIVATYMPGDEVLILFPISFPNHFFSTPNKNG
jgi:hypothetical protein